MSTTSHPSSGTTPPIDQRTPEGTLVGGRFEIGQEIGRSELDRVYLANDSDHNRLALKILTQESAPHYAELAPILDLACRCNHKFLSRLVAHGIHDHQPFLALDHVEGQTLHYAIERKRASSAAFLPRIALSLLTPICKALTAVHEHLPHAAITPANIYVDQTGRTRLANLGYGWLVQEILRDKGLGAIFDSPFIAPEVRGDSSKATPKSDIYSLAMVTISLLTGRMPPQTGAREFAEAFIFDVPATLARTLQAALAEGPSSRPGSTRDFLDQLVDGMEDLRDQLIEITGDHNRADNSAPSHPTIDEHIPARDGMLSGLFAAAELPPLPKADDPAVWLVHRGGLDYGPYSAEQIREQLLNDDIDENTEIRNLESAETTLLSECPEFAEFVADYIPEREERRRHEAARRAEVQKKVKRAGATGIITALVGVIGVLALYFYYVAFVRDDPEPIPFTNLLARVRSNFAAPNLSYVGIAADPDLIASLFDFEEEEVVPTTSRRRSSDATGRPVAEAEDYRDPADRGTIDFTASAGSRRLTAGQINSTIRTRGADVRRCFSRERVSNRNYNQLGRITVQFVVNPDGTPHGVDLRPGRYTDELRNCMVSVFRSLRYPEFDGLSLPVTFPIDVR